MSDERLTGKDRGEWEDAVVRKASKPNMKHMLRALLKYARGKPDCWPSIRSLCDETGIGERQAKRIIGDLLIMGVVSQLEDGSKSTHRIFVFPSHPGAAAVFSEYGINAPRGDMGDTPKCTPRGDISNAPRGDISSRCRGVAGVTRILNQKNTKRKNSVSQSGADRPTDDVSTSSSGWGPEEGRAKVEMVCEALWSIPSYFKELALNPEAEGRFRDRWYDLARALVRISVARTRPAQRPSRYLETTMNDIKANGLDPDEVEKLRKIMGGWKPMNPFKAREELKEAAEAEAASPKPMPKPQPPDPWTFCNNHSRRLEDQSLERSEALAILTKEADAELAKYDLEPEVKDRWRSLVLSNFKSRPYFARPRTNADAYKVHVAGPDAPVVPSVKGQEPPRLWRPKKAVDIPVPDLNTTDDVGIACSVEFVTNWTRMRHAELKEGSKVMAEIQAQGERLKINPTQQANRAAVANRVLESISAAS